MSANLLELQEMLRKISMPEVQQVASGNTGKAPQLLAMDEIKRRGEIMAEARGEQAEQQSQEPPMIDQYLAMSQQMMGSPVPQMGSHMASAMMPPMPQPPVGLMPQAPAGFMPQRQMPQQLMAQPVPRQVMPQQMQGIASMAGPRPAPVPQQLAMAGPGYRHGGIVDSIQGFSNGGQPGGGIGIFKEITPDAQYGGGTFGFNPVTRKGTESYEEVMRQLDQIKELERLGFPLTQELKDRKSYLIDLTPSTPFYNVGDPGRRSFSFLGELYDEYVVQGDANRRRIEDEQLINEEREELGLNPLVSTALGTSGPKVLESLNVDLGSEPSVNKGQVRNKSVQVPNEPKKTAPFTGFPGDRERLDAFDEKYANVPIEEEAKTALVLSLEVCTTS